MRQYVSNCNGIDLSWQVKKESKWQYEYRIRKLVVLMEGGDFEADNDTLFLFIRGNSFFYDDSCFFKECLLSLIVISGYYDIQQVRSGNY